MSDTEQALTFSNLWAVFVFCLGIYALSAVIRMWVEIWKPTLKTSNVWTLGVLPTTPILLGALLALVATKFPYPSLVHATSTRVLFGVTCGLFSGWVYRIVKSIIKLRFPGTTPPDGEKDSDVGGT